VFTARYAMSPDIKQIRFVFKGLTLKYLRVSHTVYSDSYFPIGVAHSLIGLSMKAYSVLCEVGHNLNICTEKF
jgi:hypothetical protein